MEHLGITRNWHFPNDLIDAFAGTAHIPIRDPYAVSKSWQERYGGDPRRIEFDDWDRLIDYSERPNAILYRMEDISVRIGADDPPGNKPYPLSDDEFRQTERFAKLKEWIPDRMPFFSRFYDEFEWL